MGRKAKAVRETTETVISDGGEVLADKKTETTMWETEPPYVKMYLTDIGRLKKLNKTENAVVRELLSKMGYNNVVPAYKPIKEMIAHNLGKPYATVNQAIKGLASKGVLIRQARGFYIMDPELFGRGSWKNVKSIRMTVEYNADGSKQISSEVSSQLGINFSRDKAVKGFEEEEGVNYDISDGEADVID